MLGRGKKSFNSACEKTEPPPFSFLENDIAELKVMHNISFKYK